ncbi:MAG: NUDIX domain-containing protein [Endomicrobium sp.]|jgi:8-oxo-dGTP pyrophosphatase MutT (NUDIX family)|nr:NUDIX domain-containing protein [Endomicrobium sp.]
MLEEFSYGAIIYKIQNCKPIFLLVCSKSKIWGFPKGHSENGENKIETARREIFEETGIKNIRFIKNFVQEDIYLIKKKHISIPRYILKKTFFIIKHSVYFLAFVIHSDLLSFDKNEIVELKWVNIKQSQNLLSFDSQKRIINLAYKSINQFKKEDNYEQSTFKE